MKSFSLLSFRCGRLHLIKLISLYVMNWKTQNFETRLKKIFFFIKKTLNGPKSITGSLLFIFLKTLFSQTENRLTTEAALENDLLGISFMFLFWIECKMSKISWPGYSNEISAIKRFIFKCHVVCFPRFIDKTFSYL